MSMKEAGWIMLFAETNQEAADLHIQAFRLAEALSCPVMVCVDGFILTHAYERIDLPTQEQADSYLPPFVPMQVLDPADPVSIGAMVGPEGFTEVRYLAHHKQLRALEMIPELAAEFELRFGRASGGLLHSYRADDAQMLIVAMGSVNGTIKDVIDEMREDGHAIGCVAITSFRPFPLSQLHAALERSGRVVVVEKSLAVGLGGVLASSVRMAMRGLATPVYTAIAGLGGRPITKGSLRRLFEGAERGELEEVTFVDLNKGVVQREIERMDAVPRPGPIAENILRSAGPPMSRAV
jgi:pyruvate ferredoxin oxidoreductase alpha subunit